MNRSYFTQRLITITNDVFGKQCCYVRRIRTKVNIIHRIRKEDKLLFGELIKPYKQNTRILKNVDTLVEEENEKLNINDLEFAWQMKHNGNKLKKYKLISYVSEDVKVDKIVEPITTENLKTDCSEDANDISCSKLVPKENNTQSQGILQQQDPSSMIEKLPQIIINNIVSFPIFNREKDISNLSSTMDILSLSAEDNPTSSKYPAISTILRNTMSEEAQKALEGWKKNMIEHLGEEGFNLHVKNQLETGRAFHACIENRLYGKNDEVPEIILPFYESVNGVFQELDSVKAVETHVAHTKLHYKGIIDCIAYYRGKLCLIDWKKSDKKKFRIESTYDAPLQVAAYIGAVNSSKVYPFMVETGLVVVANADGSPANVYQIEDQVLQKYWEKWLLRLQQYLIDIDQEKHM